MNDSNLNENFNRIEGGTPSQLRGGASVGDPNKFYNKKLQSGLTNGWFRYDSTIDTPHGKIYLERAPFIEVAEIMSQNSSMEEIEASE